MRVLLDACVPRKLRNELIDHDVETARGAGLNELDDGLLLDAMANRFDALVTVDKSIPFQQTIAGRSFSIILLRARSNSSPTFGHWFRLSYEPLTTSSRATFGLSRRQVTQVSERIPRLIEYCLTPAAMQREARQARPICHGNSREPAKPPPKPQAPERAGARVRPARGRELAGFLDDRFDALVDSANLSQFGALEYAVRSPCP